MENVLVIGSGVIGLSSACYLQQSGHKVTVLDKAGFTDNCSYGNLGYVCPAILYRLLHQALYGRD